jgi:ATP-dependent HslUV protease ATP-binding subunit HslU
VELRALIREDFIRILTEPENALTRQYVALMETENVHLTFTADAVAALAEIAAEVNSRSENIGARRLHTVLERLLEELSFSAPELNDRTVTVDSDYVHQRLDPIVKNEDLSRYIL